MELRTTSDRDWVPPATREEAAQRIEELTNDIGIIQAQLAEHSDQWCQRTGLSLVQYMGWRRKALFAKTYKEGQLRQCKRLRASFPPSPYEDGSYISHLLALARNAVAAWEELPSSGRTEAFDVAMNDLRQVLESSPQDQPRDLVELIAHSASARGRLAPEARRR